jgi:hypothetical protein
MFLGFPFSCLSVNLIFEIKSLKKVDFLDRTTYFRFFIAFDLLNCNFLKFPMVTEVWNLVVRAKNLGPAPVMKKSKTP